MPVTFFRQRIAGPELVVEDTVASRIPDLFKFRNRLMWTAGSPPIGAGRPDLVVVACEPQVFALANVAMPTSHILGYLRAVGRAKAETISERVGGSVKVIVRCLEGLRQIEVVSASADVYTLAPDWRHILPDIVAIEVKVADWRKAISQAARNRIFAHRSFVAFPRDVADRSKGEPILSRLGIGVLSVGDDGEVHIVKQARRHRPCVWTYYYQLAHIVANHLGESNALCGSNC